MEIVGKNSFSNLAAFLLKSICTIVVTKILYTSLGEAGYGYWGFLWSLYGYSLLLDFGLGWSVQKAAAEFINGQNSSKLNKVISTVFFSYLMLGGLIAVISMLLCEPFLNMFSGSMELGYLSRKESFLIFSIGTSLIFPTGVFSEVLVGIKKHFIRNYTRVFHYTVNILGIVYFSTTTLTIEKLTYFTVFNHLICNLILLIFVKREVPTFRISPVLFKLELLPELAKFSGYAYIVVFNSLLMLNTDQLLIGNILSLSAIGAYQLGSRLSQFLRQFADQFQEVIFPNVVSLKNKEGDSFAYMTMAFKFTLFIVQPVFIFSFIYAEDILTGWVGEVSPAIVLICQLCLLYTFVSAMFKGTVDKYLMGVSLQKSVAKVSIGEIVTNIFCSLILVKSLGVIGAPLGSIVTILLSLAISYPLVFRRSLGRSYALWISEVCSKNFQALLVALSFLAVIRKVSGPLSLPALFVWSQLFFVLYLLLLSGRVFDHLELRSILPSKMKHWLGLEASIGGAKCIKR